MIGDLNENYCTHFFDLIIINNVVESFHAIDLNINTVNPEIINSTLTSFLTLEIIANLCLSLYLLNTL